MKTPLPAGWHFNQHAHAYRDARTRLSRAAAVAVIFAVLVLMKVVTPYSRLTEERAQTTQKMAELTKKRDENRRRSHDLEEVSRQFGQVVAAIDEEPWSVPVEKLKEQFRELAHSYDVIRTASSVEIQEAYRTREADRGREILQREQFPIRDQLHPSPDIGIEGGRFMRQIPPLGTDRPRRAQPPVMAKVGDQTVAQANRQLLIAEAAERIGLDTNRFARLLRQTPTSDWARRIGEEARQLSQEAASEEAEEAVENIFQVIAARVLNAIQALVDLPMTSAVLPDLPERLRSLTAMVEEWRDNHLKDPNWYQSALGKEEELAGLTAELVAATQPIRNLLDAEQSEAERRQEELDQTISEANSRIDTLEEEVSGIDAKLEQQLPQCLRGIVDTGNVPAAALRSIAEAARRELCERHASPPCATQSSLAPRGEPSEEQWLFGAANKAMHLSTFGTSHRRTDAPLGRGEHHDN